MLVCWEIRGKKRQAKDTSEVFMLNKWKPQVSSERKKKKHISLKNNKFWVLKDIRKEMTCKGQDVALKF